MLSIIKKFLAKHIYHVPFRKKEWYNFQAMMLEEDYPKMSYIEIFDEQGKYIPCPSVGNEVTYHIHGVPYLYKIVGFQNDRKDKDWLYPDTDWINPIIQFKKKL